MMYSVSSELYLEVAARLAEAIGGGSYFSGSLTFPFGDMECRLTASVIVYPRRGPPFFLFLPCGCLPKSFPLSPLP